MTQWWLYIDESGRFERRQDNVSVGGVLAVDDSLITHTNKLKATLQRLAPEMPWPLHAAFYGLPLALGLAARVNPERRRNERGERLHRLGIDASQALMEHHKQVDAFVASFQNGREPTSPEGTLSIFDLDRLLQAAAPSTWRNLSNACVELRAEIARALVAVAPAADVAVIAVGETERGDGSSGGVDRYLGLLRATARRAGQLVRARAGEHRIEVVPLQREVRHPEFGDGMPLNTREVQPILDAAVAGIVGVKLRAHPAPKWNGQMHSALVFADFIANSARAVLASTDRLSATEEGLQALLGAPVRSASGSHLHASGLADDIVAAGGLLAEHERRAAASTVKRWAIEEARERVAP